MSQKKSHKPHGQSGAHKNGRQPASDNDQSFDVVLEAADENESAASSAGSDSMPEGSILEGLDRGSKLESLQDGVSSGVEMAKEAVGTAIETARDAAANAADKVETMAQDAQEAIVDTGRAVVETARRNPLPAALAGIGLACAGVGVTMLVLDAREQAQRPRQGAQGNGGARAQRRGVPTNGEQKRRPASGTFKRAVGNVGDEAGRLAHRAQAKLGDATRSAGETVGRVVEQAKTQGRRAGTALKDAYDTNPLAVGAAVVAAGTIVGMAIPSTRREDRLLGEGRDQIVQKAEQVARRAMDKVDRLIHPAE